MRAIKLAKGETTQGCNVVYLSLHATVEGVARLPSTQANNKGLELRVDIDGSLPDFFAAGMDAYLTKPIDRGAPSAMLGGLLQNSACTSTSRASLGCT